MILFLSLCFPIANALKISFIFQQYASGELLTGELKKILIETLQPIISEHQMRRSKITDEDVRLFMTPRALNFKFN